jgi:hypothetical protein
MLNIVKLFWKKGKSNDFTKRIVRSGTVACMHEVGEKTRRKKATIKNQM